MAKLATALDLGSSGETLESSSLSPATKFQIGIHTLVSNIKYTREVLEPIIEQCKTWAEVCRSVGITPMTGAQTHLKKVALKFGLSDAHFVGRRSNKGRTFPKKHPLSYYLQKGIWVNRQNLRKRLIQEGVKKEECESCGLREWLGDPIVLELDHINSDPQDNRLENLQILCPNCHATKTRRCRTVHRHETSRSPPPDVR